MVRSILTRVSRRTRLMAAAGGLAVVATIAGFASAAAPASATSVWCNRWGSVYVPVAHVSIPVGQYCFGVEGSGTTVNSTSGSINTPWIINYSEVVRFYNNAGTNYRTFTESAHRGYAYGAHYWTTDIHGQAQPGRACGTLTASGRGSSRSA